MASLTSWSRLEPLPRTSDLVPALEARIADPLWLLARQWQTLEFQGEDAGSPIVARITADTARLNLIAIGQDAETAASYDHRQVPLEPVIESESFDHADSERLRVEAGLHFLRLLTKHRAAGMRARYTTLYAFAPGAAGAVDPVPSRLEPPADGRASGFREMARGRAPDGAKVFADLAAHRGQDPALTSLPAKPQIPDLARPKVIAAANEWLEWYSGFFANADGAGAWDSARMEYSFAVAAETADGQFVLSADEYADGHLDWHAFRRPPETTLTGISSESASRQIVRTVIPTPASYAGMPVARFWQFEDGNISFGSLEAGPSDLTRMVLIEFALVYGNDWFVVPLDLEVGSLCAITSFEIVDTFGVVSLIEQVRSGGGWAMFEMTGATRSPDRPSPFFLPPTLARTIDGDPVESVALIRDEMANMVWGIENAVQSSTGDVIDRRERPANQGIGLQQIEGDITDAELIYRLATPVPDHWIPFVPVPIVDGEEAVVLERRAMRKETPAGPIAIEPLGRLLEPGRVLRVDEETVPREGVVLERAFQLARWTDGSTHLWLGRRKKVGRGEGRSGLRFDVVERTEN